MIAFGEQQEASGCFEIESLAARGERAHDHSTWRGERLFGPPQNVLPLSGADDDKLVRIEPELC